MQWSTLPNECRQRKVTEGTFHAKRSEWKGTMQWSTLPSECRQRKDPYLAPWGEKGGEASWVQRLPWGY